MFKEILDWKDFDPKVTVQQYVPASLAVTSGIINLVPSSRALLEIFPSIFDHFVVASISRVTEESSRKRN